MTTKKNKKTKCCNADFNYNNLHFAFLCNKCLREVDFKGDPAKIQVRLRRYTGD